MFQQYRREHEPRLGEQGDLAHLTGWANKLPGQLLRIAALFALVAEPNADTVPLGAMQSALSLSPYLVGQALYVHGAPVIGATAKVLEAVCKQPAPVFTTRDVHRKVQNRAWCQQADQVQYELGHLARAGFIRRRPSEYGSKSEHWERHPYLVA